MVVVARHRARVDAVTVTGMIVTVQAAMAGEMIVRLVVVDAPSGVMIARQVAVDAQSANFPMVIAVKRDQPVVAVLKVVAAQTVMIVQTVMPAQPAVASHHSVTSQPAVASHHSVTSQPAVASHHSVTSQHVAASHHPVTSHHVAASHLAASLPLTNVRILVTNRRRLSHRQIATMVAQNAHHQPRKSASVQRGQAVMPHRRAARAR